MFKWQKRLPTGSKGWLKPFNESLGKTQMNVSCTVARPELFTKTMTNVFVTEASDLQIPPGYATAWIRITRVLGGGGPPAGLYMRVGTSQNRSIYRNGKTDLVVLND